LYVFSTSTVFEAEKGYTKFSAYTLLNHNGDFSAAARELVELGYSTKKER
jgi:putative DNA primase/helicase